MKFFTRKQKETKQKAEVQSPLLKAKSKPITLLIITILFTILSSNLVLASSLDTSDINNTINSFRYVLEEVAPTICMLAFGVGGVMFMFGRQGRENAKTLMLFAGMGLAIVRLAESIVNLITGF